MAAVCLPFGASSEVALYTAVCLFGFSSGGWASLSLSPVCAGQLCRTEEYRRFYRTLHFSDEHRKRDNMPVSGQLVRTTTLRVLVGFHSGMLCVGLVSVVASCWALLA